MEPENPSKMPIFPGFHPRAWPGLAIPACFWAEKLILVIIHQFLPREAKVSIFKLHFSVLDHCTEKSFH
jgi:hypothetical protein